MRSDGEAFVALWLLAWHGRADEGIAVLTELGMGPEDARRTLASTPALLARQLSPSVARDLAGRLEALGGQVEIRSARPTSAATSRPTRDLRPSSAPTVPAPSRAPWYRRTIPNVIAGLFLCFMLFEGLRTAGVVSGGRASPSGPVAPDTIASDNVARGILEEARNHRADPVVTRLFEGIERGDQEIAAEASQAQFRGLQYLDHAELVQYFDLMKRGLESPTGCGVDRSLSQLTEAEQVQFGRLNAKAIVLGARERPPTSGHERALEEGVRFAFRQLPAHEQPELLALAGRAEEGEGRAVCEWSVTLIRASESMHADLQRRFLRALAHDLAATRGAL